MCCCDFRVVCCSGVVQMLFRCWSDCCSDFGSGGHFRSGYRQDCAQLSLVLQQARYTREKQLGLKSSQYSKRRRGAPRVTTTAHAHNSAHILHIISFLEDTPGLFPGAPGIWPLGLRCAAQLLRAARQWCSLLTERGFLGPGFCLIQFSFVLVDPWRS